MAFFAYLVVDDVDAYCQRAWPTGAKIVKPIANEPWRMREFGLHTVGGHRIILGQEIKAG
ncbi:MAG: hypothetical protein U1F68_20930 [Gammaproteobacteria bacterium]